MGKIYEALENARIGAERPDVWGGERNHIGRDHSQEVEKVLSVEATGVSQVNMETEMIRLHQSLDTLLPAAAHRLIQFIGSREGEGTSTVVHAFARVSATRFDERVLCLEMNRQAPGSSEVGPDGVPTGVAASNAGGTRLYIAPLPQELVAAPHPNDARRLAAVWERLRTAYDLVVIDSPPATTSSEGLAVCGHVDGVILILAAEETRWPVAERVKESIERNGGRLLGVVFNKRQYYIPQFIYGRL